MTRGSSRPILIVDDERAILTALETLLQQAGYDNVVVCSDSREVEGLLNRDEPELILLDLYMPHVEGKDLLRHLTRDFPQVPVIVVTGAVEIETAVQCMKEGAFDYLVKPVEEASVLAAVKKALDFSQLRRQNLALKERLLSSTLERSEVFAPILTKSKAMLSLFRYLEAMAPSRQPILITGETGVGKELFARAAHLASDREGEFVPVNAAGLDDTVFSDTLFGHAKGAFTGAERARGGLIEKAARGTLFLDEIGDLHPTSQVKLLRLVEGGEYLPLGQDQVRVSDARIVAATNQDLWDLKRSNRFRADLNFRLRSIHIHVPPLRERLEDLPLLVDHFLDQAAQELGKKRPTPPKELISLLGAYRFPGNIRELKTMIFDAVGRHRVGVMSLKTFQNHIGRERDLAHGTSSDLMEEGPLSFPAELPTIKQATDLLVAEALRRSGGNQSMAARLLGVTPQAISKRLRHSKPS